MKTQTYPERLYRLICHSLYSGSYYKLLLVDIPWVWVVCLINTRKVQGSQAWVLEGVYIRQTMSAYGVTTVWHFHVLTMHGQALSSSNPIHKWYHSIYIVTSIPIYGRIKESHWVITKISLGELTTSPFSFFHSTVMIPLVKSKYQFNLVRRRKLANIPATYTVMNCVQ